MPRGYRHPTDPSGRAEDRQDYLAELRGWGPSERQGVDREIDRDDGPWPEGEDDYA